MTSSLDKIFMPLLMASLLLAITGCTTKTEEKTTSKGQSSLLAVEAFVVDPEVFENKYIASGSLLPNEELDIHPEVTGRVTRISFEEGTNVRRGQTLIQLYDADIRAQLKKLQAQRGLQRNTLGRQKELVEIGGISRQDYETTQTQISSIEADIAFAQAQLRATKIIAPFDGKIGIRNISLGAVVSPSTLIATLQQVHPLKMDFTVPAQYKKYMSNGKKVKFSVTGINDTLEGKIIAVDPGANADTRTVRVRASVPNPQGRLTAGSFARVIIPFESDDDAILIPSQAVIPTVREKVVVRIQEGKAEMVTVQLGVRTSSEVEVLSGLNAGDTVVITGLMQVKPGTELKVTKLHR